MTNVMKQLVATPLRYILLCSLLLGLATVTALFFWVDDEKWSAFLGGISGGLLGVTITFIFSMYEYGEIERYRALGVLNILPNRRDDSYYKKIVKNAQKNVQVMGTSCARFIEDFADADSDEHVLIVALDRHKNLRVELLAPTEEQMDEQSKLKFKAGHNRLRQLQNQFQDRVQLKRYDFQARHSLVRVDNNLIVGPVFQGVESQNSPAIHLDTNKDFAEKYLKYFEWAWEKSQPCHAE